VLALEPRSVYDAVVFDNDGVLTERTDREVLERAAREAFEAFDVDPDPEAVRAMVAGVDHDRLHAVCEEHGLDPAAFWRERDERFVHHQRRETEAGRKPTYDDVDVLESLSLPLGVVSNNQDATIDHLFEFHGIHGHFETWYGRAPTVESVRRKKPEPHYLERALGDLGAETALYVGDKGTDVAAAHAAGIDSALVRREHNREVTPSTPPTYDLDSLAELPDAPGVY